MILRKDYVKLIQEGKAQVEVERTEEHNEMLNLIFPKRLYYNFEGMGRYFTFDNGPNYRLSNYRLSNEPFNNLPIIHASDIILDNTVIKVESLEHGKKVIEWWKEQGVDVIYTGDNIGRYYGIYDGDFTYYSEKSILKMNKKIITLPESFHEKWYMKVTEENKDVVNEWRKGVATDFFVSTVGTGDILMSYHRDGGYSYFGGEDALNIEYPNHKEITTGQFLKHVYEPWKNKSIELTKQENKMRTITWEQGQELIDMVDISCSWKGKLLDLWAKAIVLKQEIAVSEELLQQGRKDASQGQKEVIDRIFGKEKEEIDLRSGVNDYSLFHSNARQSETMIGIRSGNEYSRKAFFLSKYFNWEMKKDSNGVLCLIPTHK